MSADDKRDPQDLAGQYVIGTLPAAERRALEQALPQDPELRAAVAAWETRLLPLTALVEPEQPSAQLWPRIARSLAAQQAAAPAPRPGWWERLNLWRGLAAAGVAAAVVMAVLTLQPQPAAPQYMVVLAAPQNMSPGWVLQSAKDGNLRLVPLRPTEVPAARSLQLWTKADGWDKPVSLGLVEPGKAVDVPLRGLPPLQPNQLFEITLEPGTGSPTGRPTGPILYIGRAVRL